MELRVATGRAGRLAWVAPCFLTGDAVLTVQHPAVGDVQPRFAVVQPAVSVTSVAQDERTLTLADPLDLPASLVAGDEGDAYLRLPDGAVLEVTVEAIAGATIRLAEGLRRDTDAVSVDTPATLQWATWVATIDGALTAAPMRSIPYVVEASGLGALGSVAIEEPGALHVVRRPFSTGVTVGALHRHRAGLAATEYRRVSHGPAVAAAFDRLVTWLRADIGPGRWEDDVFNGADFRLVHLELAVAELEADPERARMVRAEARSLYREKTERVLRTAETGQPDADVDLGGAVATHTDGGYAPARSRRRRW